MAASTAKIINGIVKRLTFAKPAARASARKARAAVPKIKINGPIVATIPRKTTDKRSSIG